MTNPYELDPLTRDLGEAADARRELSPLIMRNRWAQVCQNIIEARNSLSYLGKSSDHNGLRDTAEQKKCYRRAARALGPAITHAVEQQKHWESKCPQPKPLNITLLTESEYAHLGKRMADNPQAITTNTEGAAFLDHQYNQKLEAIERDGCCGETPSADGYCYGYGECPNFRAARIAGEFAERLVAWVEQLSEQTALAAVAVRLNDVSPFSSEVCHD